MLMTGPEETILRNQVAVMQTLEFMMISQADLLSTMLHERFTKTSQR